jgi:WD40 repeat protein
VYDAGECAGELYYAMRRVSGRPFLALIERARDIADRLALLPHVLAVSEAVAYAHRRGIIHRDLKPNNILVGELGETVVVDWGLAKRIQPGAAHSPDGALAAAAPSGQVEHTRAGELLGTPGYMAPEQMDGRPADARVDVYALGAILRQVLTGCLPQESPPEPVLTELRDRVPDLLTLIAKTMAVDPAERYATAEDLAEELQRFQTGKLLGVHQYSLGALIRRWVGRHRALVGAVGGLAAVLVAVVALSAARVVGERDRAKAARADADAARARAEARQRELILIKARDDLDRDPTASLAWLKTYPHSAETIPTERAIAADAWAHGVASHVIRSADAFSMVAAFADGHAVAATTAAGDLVIVDSATGARTTLHAEDGIRFTLQVARDGRSAATSDARGVVRLWDLAAGTSHKLDTCAATSLGFSRDGAFLIGRNALGGACLWELATGVRRPLPADTISAVLLADRRGVVLSRAHELDVLDLDSGELSAQLALPSRPLRLAASADGRWFAVTLLDHVIMLDRRRHTQTILRVDEAPGGVILSGDGRWAVLCGQSGTLWAFDLDRGGPPRVFTGQGCFHHGVQFSPDGSVLTMANGAGVNVLDPESGTQRPFAARQGAIADLSVSANGTLLASLTSDGVLSMYRLGEGDVRAFPGRSAPTPVSSSGTLVLRNARDGALVIGNLRGELTPPISTARPSVAAQSGTISSDGHRLVFAEPDGSVIVYEPATGRRTVLPPDAGEHALDLADALTIDGSQFAFGGDDRAIHLIDTRTGARRILGKQTDLPVSIAFSWNGRMLASAGRDGVLKLWDVASGATLSSLAGHGSLIFDVRFSRDDTRVVTANSDGTARVWDVASGRSTVLAGHQAALQSADFSPDGAVVVTASADGAVTRWDLATGQPTILRRETADLDFVRFSIDGKLVLTSGPRRVRLWDPSVPRIPDQPAAFAAWLARTTTAEVDAQGQLASPDR